jgi:hypothetical protein
VSQEYKSDDSTPSSGEIKNVWILASTPLYIRFEVFTPRNYKYLRYC